MYVWIYILGVIDQASIRAAVARQETVEMVSRSVVDLGPGRGNRFANKS